MLSPDSLKSVTAVLWDALDMHGRFLNSSTLRRESFEFGRCISVVFFIDKCCYITRDKIVKEEFQI